ncbi:MAG: prepilin-type N-terminal cleavage/methylation domain-containing protein [candidate division NC10 bacterium]|nr:prepilin-type N-terminal cleavage/methylation domain-containing protein [candidate division NC10 bacterium]
MLRGPTPTPTSLRALRGRSGVTLIEALITTVLFSLVMSGVYVFYTTMQGTLSRGEMKTDLQQSARIGLNRMVREIRMLGYDPESAIATLIRDNPSMNLGPRPLLDAAIRAASPDCFSFVTYYNDNSSPPAVLRTIQVTYTLGPRPALPKLPTLQRQQDAWDATSRTFTLSSTQPQAESVNLLSFMYYDQSNGILSPSGGLTYKCPPGSSYQPSSQLDYSQIRAVRRVAITLQTQGSPFRAAAEFYTLTGDVYLRNR